MEEITLFFDNAQERSEDVIQCIMDLVPCKAKITEDNTGIYIKKSYSNDEEFDEIKKVIDKYDLMEIY